MAEALEATRDKEKKGQGTIENRLNHTLVAEALEATRDKEKKIDKGQKTMDLITLRGYNVSGKVNYSHCRRHQIPERNKFTK